MRVELQYRNSPIIWVTFLLFLSFYYNGFSTAGYDALEKLSIHIDSNKRVQIFLVLFFLISISSAWLTLIAERKDLVRLRKAYRRAFTSGERLSALTLVPKWLVSAALSVLLLGAMVAASLTFGPLEGSLDYSSNLIAGALVLFFVRDALIVLLCHTGGRFKARANMAALVYLFCLYSVLPWFLQVAGMRTKLHWAYPYLVAQPLDLLAIFLQIAIAVTLYSSRLREIRKAVHGTAPLRG